MMQMLRAGGLSVLTDSQRTADDDNPRGYFEFEAVKATKQDSSWLDQARGKVVKMVHLLLPDLPPGREYQIVMMHRDIAEVLASQRKMLERNGKRGASLPDAQMAALYNRQMKNVLERTRSQPNIRLVEVPYRDVIFAPAQIARLLSEFLGGDLNEAAMSEAVDPSLYRNRDTSRQAAD